MIPELKCPYCGGESGIDEWEVTSFAEIRMKIRCYRCGLTMERTTLSDLEPTTLTIWQSLRRKRR